MRVNWVCQVSVGVCQTSVKSVSGERGDVR